MLGVYGMRQINSSRQIQQRRAMVQGHLQDGGMASPRADYQLYEDQNRLIAV